MLKKEMAYCRITEQTHKSVLKFLNCISTAGIFLKIEELYLQINVYHDAVSDPSIRTVFIILTNWDLAFV